MVVQGLSMNRTVQGILPPGILCAHMLCTVCVGVWGACVQGWRVFVGGSDVGVTGGETGLRWADMPKPHGRGPATLGVAEIVCGAQRGWRWRCLWGRARETKCEQSSWCKARVLGHWQFPRELSAGSACFYICSGGAQSGRGLCGSVWVCGAGWDGEQCGVEQGGKRGGSANSVRHGVWGWARDWRWADTPGTTSAGG